MNERNLDASALKMQNGGLVPAKSVIFCLSRPSCFVIYALVIVMYVEPKDINPYWPR